MVSDSPQSERSKRAQWQESTSSSIIYAQKSHTISYWFYGSELFNVPMHNGRIIQEHICQEVRIIGTWRPSWMLATVCCSVGLEYPSFSSWPLPTYLLIPNLNVKTFVKPTPNNSSFPSLCLHRAIFHLYYAPNTSHVNLSPVCDSLPPLCPNFLRAGRLRLNILAALVSKK